MQLLLANYIENNSQSSALIQEVLDIVTWFNNHSCALHLLYAEQRTFEEFAKQVLTLLKPVITRWCLHSYSLSQLIKLEVPLHTTAVKWRQDLHMAAGKKADQIQKAKAIIAMILRVSFWADIKMYVINICGLWPNAP
jgi:hypothetical protein